MAWTPQSLKFYLDDKEYGSYDISGPQSESFHKPFFLILNVAVGGFANAYTGISKPEMVTAALPGRMAVDWIRVTKNEFTKIFRGKQDGAVPLRNKTAKIHLASGPSVVRSPRKQKKNGSDAVAYSWADRSP